MLFDIICILVLIVMVFGAIDTYFDKYETLSPAEVVALWTTAVSLIWIIVRFLYLLY